MPWDQMLQMLWALLCPQVFFDHCSINSQILIRQEIIAIDFINFILKVRWIHLWNGRTTILGWITILCRIIFSIRIRQLIS
jgi:hypothetical protein